MPKSRCSSIWIGPSVTHITLVPGYFGIVLSYTDGMVYLLKLLETQDKLT